MESIGSFNTLHLLLFALLGWALRNIFRDILDRIKVISEAQHAHEKSCNEIPKSLLVERIDNVDKSVDEVKRDIRDMRNDLKQRDANIDLKFADISYAMRNVVGR